MSKTKFKQTEMGLIPKDWNINNFNHILVGGIKHGIYKSQEHYDLSGIRLLKMGLQYSTNRIGSQNMDRVIVSKEELDRFKLQIGDLVFSRTSMMTEGAGKCSLIIKHENPIIFDGNLLCATLNKTVAISEFFYYFFNSSLAQNEIKKITTGTQSRNISGSNISKILIPLPPLPEQKVIAKILSDLDEKIELNRKMNQTLEEIGKTLFKRWFVDFEFPNEKGEPYKSSGGEMVYNEKLKKEIPKSWSVDKLGVQLKTILGGTPSTTNKNYWDGNIPWINSGAINDFPVILPTSYITEKGVNESAAKLMPIKTIVLPFVISVDKEIKISLTAIETTGNQSVLGILQNEELSAEYVYFYINSIIPEIYSSATGGAQQHINKAVVDNSYILLPNREILKRYNDILIPIFNNIFNNSYEIRELAKIRDYLLPKLMSGKIRVKY